MGIEVNVKDFIFKEKQVFEPKPKSIEKSWAF